MTRSSLRKPLVLLVACTCLAGSLIGWLLGRVAGSLYGVHVARDGVTQLEPVIQVAHWLGAISGLLAGGLWCRMMVPRLVRARPGNLVTAGAGAGVGVGLLSTLILHSGLMTIKGAWTGAYLGVGLALGVPAAGILGAVCGALCRRAIVAARLQASGEDGEREL